MNQDNLTLKKQTPANDGDELDVLQAGLLLEEKMGKKILTDEQRALLVSSGRITQQQDETAINLDTMQKTIKGLVLLMQQNLIETFVGSNDMSEWDNASKEVRVGISRDLFKLMYGYSPENMVKYLMGKFSIDD